MESPSNTDSSPNVSMIREPAPKTDVSPHHEKKIHEFTEKSHQKHHRKHKKHHHSGKHYGEAELRLPLAAHPDHHDDHQDEIDHHDSENIVVSQDSPVDSPQKYFGGRISADTLKLIHVAFCFMILLAALSTCSSLIGPIYQQVGILSLGIQNLGFAIGSLMAPSIVFKVGVRVTMVASAAVYTGYIAIVQLNIIWVLLVASFIRGISGGTIWNAQAVYLGNLCERHPGRTGRLSGLFFGVYSFNVLVGSLITGIPLLLSNTGSAQPQDPTAALDSVRTNLWVLTGMGSLATVLFVFIRPAEPLRPVQPVPFTRHIKDTFSLLKNKTMLYLLIWSFMAGYVICFMWGPVATLYNNIQLVPMLFVGFGAAFTAASFATGKIYDSKGWKPIMWIYVVAHIVAYILCGIAFELKVDALFYIAAILFGWIEAQFGTLSEAAFIQVFMSNFVQSFGQATAYIMSAYISHWIILGINVALLIGGTITLWIGMSRTASNGSPAQPTVSQKVLSPKSHHR